MPAGDRALHGGAPVGVARADTVLRPMAPARLNLGSGTDVREGYVNLDIAALPGVDVVHDLSRLPLPFEDAQFEEVLCKDILEHLDYVPVLRELHRIIRPGGRL